LTFEPVENATSEKIMRTFVVGITGHRLNKIPAEGVARVEQELSYVFAQIDAACAEQASKSEAVHDCALHRVRLVSSLAEGADQIAVFVRPKAWSVEAVLPFPRVRYLSDFAPERATGGVDRRPEFEAALAQSQTIVELPDEGDAPSAYERAGRYILQECDLLVAVWDGMPEAGTGGTKAVVAFAIEARIPVVWIRTDGNQPPTLIAGGDNAVPGLNSVAATKSSIAQVIASTVARNSSEQYYP